MKRLGAFVLSIFVFFSALAAFAGAEQPKSMMSLHQAAAKGDLEQVRQLISRGTDVNAKDTTGFTALFYAAESGHREVAGLLISAGASVNATDRYGNTPLHYAAVRGHYDVCQLLLSKGADPNARNLTGGTAVAMAKAAGHTLIVDLMSRQGPKDRAPGETARRISALATKPGEIDIDYKGVEPKGVISVTKSKLAVILADPNKIKAKLQAFPGLQQALGRVERQSYNEVRQWLQRRVDNRAILAKEVRRQFQAELDFLRRLTAEEKKVKTTAAIDGVLLLRQERFHKLTQKLQEEKQRLRPLRGIRGRYRPRYPSRRLPQSIPRQPLPPEQIQAPFADPNKIKAKLKGSPELVKVLVELDKKSENEVRQWLQKGPDNRISLATAVHEQAAAELLFIREQAVEEQAKKTTAAVDGLLLSRQKRFDSLIAKTEQQRHHVRPSRGTPGPYRSRYPGPKRGYPQNQQFRMPVPGQNRAEQNPYRDEEKQQKIRYRRR